MLIPVKCPSCGRKGKVPESSLGKNARCPACKTIFSVPTKNPEKAPPARAIDPKIQRELWLYKELGEEIGPVTFEILITLARKGEVGRESLIKKYPNGEWVLAGKVKGLFDKPVAH
jgi:hypothetical protein